MKISGPPPTPLSLRVLRGNPGKRPMPKNPPKPTAGASCPKMLSAEARAEWRRVEPELLHLGLLTQVDRAALAAYCESWADFRWAVGDIGKVGRVVEAGNGTLIPNPAVQIKRQAMQKIREFSAEFGFTPAARARIELSHAEEKDTDLDRFFGPQPVPGPKPAGARSTAKSTRRRRAQDPDTR